nr:uncharacterized protein LOC126523381 [Dermacentor andersoni]
MEYQVADTSISFAELEADSSWVRAVKAHRAAAAHQPIISPPPAWPTPKTPCTNSLRRHAPSSPPATSKHQPPPPAPPTVPILKTSRPSRPRPHSVSRGAESASRHRSVSLPPLPRSEASTAPATTTISPVSWKPQPHTSDRRTAALETTIAAQQLRIQELSRQLQAALVRLSSPAPPPTSPAPAPPQPPALAVEPMNTASSAASSRTSSPNRSPRSNADHLPSTPSRTSVMWFAKQAPSWRRFSSASWPALGDLRSASPVSTPVWPPSNHTLPL